MSDKHLRFSPQGDTAIASYLLNVKTQAKDKKVTDDVYQETDVWFKAAGGWKIAHGHDSLPTPATPK
jgi:ketosteroid isomerase-like protein